MLELREATMDDMALVYHWRNDPITRRDSHQQEPIPWEGHEAWYTERLSESPDTMWVAYYNKQPIGYGRCDDRVNYRSLISVALDVAWRRRGYGVSLIQLTTKKITKRGRIPVAHIFPANVASIAAFESAGYIKGALIGERYHEFLLPLEQVSILASSRPRRWWTRWLKHLSK